MLYSVADLDSLTCTHCRRSLREHCTAAEGAWYYSPCRFHLMTLAPAAWREQVSESGVCLYCMRLAEDHFTLWTPQVQVSLGGSAASPVSIVTSGQIVARVPNSFADCRLPGETPDLATDNRS